MLIVRTAQLVAIPMKLRLIERRPGTISWPSLRRSKQEERQCVMGTEAYGGTLKVDLAGDPPSLDMHQETTFMVNIPLSNSYISTPII
jgi:hypothetical protein